MIVVYVVDSWVDTMIVVLIVNPSTDAVIVSRRIVSPASVPVFAATAMIVACGIIGSTTMMVSTIVSPAAIIITASAIVTTAAMVIATAIVIAAPATIVRSTAGHQDRVRRARSSHSEIGLTQGARTGCETVEAQCDHPNTSENRFCDFHVQISLKKAATRLAGKADEPA